MFPILAKIQTSISKINISPKIAFRNNQLTVNQNFSAPHSHTKNVFYGKEKKKMEHKRGERERGEDLFTAKRLPRTGAVPRSLSSNQGRRGAEQEKTQRD